MFSNDRCTRSHGTRTGLRTRSATWLRRPGSGEFSSVLEHRMAPSLVSSSRSEGYPINLLEAMANGLPIVATAVGEVPSIVRDHKTGLLVSPGDVQALTDATVSLLQNAEQRRCYGSAAKALAVQEHSASRMTSEIVEIYRHALQARERNSGRS